MKIVLILIVILESSLRRRTRMLIISIRMITKTKCASQRRMEKNTTTREKVKYLYVQTKQGFWVKNANCSTQM